MMMAATTTRRSCALLMMMVVAAVGGQRLVPPRSFPHAAVAEDERDHDDAGGAGGGARKEHEGVKRLEPHVNSDYDNTTDEQYLGDPCEHTCSPLLENAFCNPATKTCECQRKYPVKLNAASGCTKPTRINEQCMYELACKYYDPHASCVQIHHNAVCQCTAGYHSVSVTKPSKRIFCAEDLVVMTTDFSTLAGVVSGIAVLSGLICFVLKLFNQNLYPGRHRYGNANLAPPILFNSDGDTTSSAPIYGSFLGATGGSATSVSGSVPIIDHHHHQRRLTMASRTPSQRTLVSTSRRPSSAPGFRYQYHGGGGGGGASAAGGGMAPSRAGAARAAAILLLSCHQVAAIPELCSRNGSRRPSIASVHSGNSVRSYSMRRYEKEREQKEEREMQRRLAKLTASTPTAASTPVAPTPSPHTPHSTDDLLPTLQEDVLPMPPPLTNNHNGDQPLSTVKSEENDSTSFQEEIPSTSRQFLP